FTLGVRTDAFVAQGSIYISGKTKTFAQDYHDTVYRVQGHLDRSCLTLGVRYSTNGPKSGPDNGPKEAIHAYFITISWG
ncbi:MAG: hypothetical protein OTI35_08465, partial [Sulfitobacter sp.]|nr:hypothetical protein [Sulfitobacter sp.]